MPSLHWRGKPENGSAPPSGSVQPEGTGGLVTEALIYPSGGTPTTPILNRLLLGDNLDIMQAILPQYEGQIALIYADPPFFTNRQFHTRIGRGEDSRRPDTWSLAEGYHDVWADLDAYIGFLYERLRLMHRLLSASGTLYLHLDWHADAYARLILDELFGPDNLVNEIVWAYHGPSAIRRAFNRKHDIILAYAKGPGYTFNTDAIRTPYDPSTVKTFAGSKKAGFGKVPDLARGKVPEDWWYFPVVARLHAERSGYPTQKPEALLDRIILASSNPGEIVADLFCGSGTTAAIAAQHGRPFLVCDSSWRAIQTTRSRLVRLRSEPFSLERLEGGRFPILAAEPIDFELRIEADSVVLSPREDIIYWEIDPGWDGQVFKSLLQAARPIRNGGIQAKLPLGERRTGHSVICVRLVVASGEQYQIILEK